MKTFRFDRPSRLLDRLPVLGPLLLTAVALLVAACNNGSGGTGY
jgi:hypothetical protein